MLRLVASKEFPYPLSMIHSRLTSKAQTTIPRPVREALGLEEGDKLTYEIEGDRAILRRAVDDQVADPFAAFNEWGEEADRRAYDGF